MIKYMIRLLLLISFCIFSVSLYATPTLKLNSNQIKVLHNIEAEYNKYLVIKSRFVQKDSLGHSAKGWLILQKPGKARIEYENIPVRFIANNNVIMYQDIKLKQKSFVQATSSPFGYLLEKKFSFFNPKISIIAYSNHDILKITVNSKKNPEMGELTLFFTSDNAELLGWKILDAKGITTEFYLNNPNFSSNLIKNTNIFNMQRIIEQDFASIK